MPCTPSSYLVRVVLDDRDRLRDYSVEDSACCRTTGTPSLLLPLVQGKSTSELIELSLEQLAVPGSPAPRARAENHLLALKSLLCAWTGTTPCTPNDAMAMSSVSFDDGEVTLTGARSPAPHAEVTSPSQRPVASALHTR